MAKATKAVTKTDGIGAAPSYVSEEVRGNENITTDDIIVPRLNLLQTISPELDENDARYIEGAKAGMFVNNLTMVLHPSPVVIIPIVYRREYVIFKERKAGGGFKGSHPTEAEALKAIAESEEGQLECIETGVHFCFLVGANGEISEIVFTMTSTKLKASRKLNSLVRLREKDRFAGTYKIVSVPDENIHGKFHTIDVVNDGWATEEQYKAAEEIYKAIGEGEREVDHSEAKGETGDEAF